MHEKTLRLKYGKSDAVSIPDVAFTDMELPYSHCFPDKCLAKEYGCSVDYCHAAHKEHSVSMIFDAKDLRKFQVLKRVAVACEYLVAIYPLGTIFWELSRRNRIFGPISTLILFLKLRRRILSLE